ncbi:MAG: hypothetical protein CMH54_09585, partial [Myxococcales bacterium]|nr:hypothetical protein [Myxococcales bacterium]
NEPDDDGDGYRICEGDCNDDSAISYPGAPEICDGLDNNCDTILDGDEHDNDGDGQRGCQGDCNDGNLQVYLGAPELCDGYDNDCDAEIDEGLDGCGPGSWPTCDTKIPGQCSPGQLVADGSGVYCKPSVDDFGVIESVTVIEGMVDRNSGFVEPGEYLMTSNGTLAFNAAAACNTNSLHGWTVRIFDPQLNFHLNGEIRTCDDDDNDTGTDDNSFFTGGIVADSDFVYAIEWAGNNGRVVRILWNTVDLDLAPVAPQGYMGTSLEDGVPPITLPSVPQNPGYRLVNGQYDWINRRVVMGGLDEPNVCYWSVPEGSIWSPNGTSGITCSDDLQKAAGAGVVGTDGVFLYSRRWGNFPGNDRILRHGYGKNGLPFASWQGYASNSHTTAATSGFYHVDGYFYIAANNCPYGLQRVRVTGSEPPGVCDNIDQNCNGIVDEICDMDNDDFCDRYIENTGYSPTCGGGFVDCDDCDPTVTCTPYYADFDNDGYGDPGQSSCDCSAPPNYVEDGSDCDGNDDTVYPGAPELCDGKDNSCKGYVSADESDADGDNYRGCNGDCDDSNGGIYPDAPEICDGLDNDCDGVIPANENDFDGDGVRVCDGDCNDGDDQIFMGNPEVCDGKDNDCDGRIDNDLPGCVPTPCDTGMSGICQPGLTVGDGSGIFCKPNPEGFGEQTEVEIPNGLIDRESGTVRVGEYLVTTNGEYVFNLAYGCEEDLYAGWTVRAFDPIDDFAYWREIRTCNDDSNTQGTDDNAYYTSSIIADDTYVYPVEWTGDSGRVLRIQWATVLPDSAPVFPNGYVGPSNGDATTLVYPTIPQHHNYRLIGGQYDWTNRRVVMGGYDEPVMCYWEVGDGAWIPNGISGLTCNTDVTLTASSGILATDGVFLYSHRTTGAEGTDRVGRHGMNIAGKPLGSWQGWASNAYMSQATTGFYYPDGHVYIAVNGCPYSLQRTRVNGSQPETCDNIDDNCNGEIDEICDMDDDDWCDRFLDGIEQPLTCGHGMLDCDDCNPHITCFEMFWDDDGDGYGDVNISACECPGTPGWVFDPTDCADDDASINPGAADICDAIDNDCDGKIDEDTPYSWYYYDTDGDNYGTDDRIYDCQPIGLFTAPEPDDCDDNNNSIYPFAPELCDGLDNDCDEIITGDEKDEDGDGFRGCDGDCDDSLTVVYPGAPEICDGLDNDCDGTMGAGEVDVDGDGAFVCSGDCDDTNPDVFEGKPELCDMLDNDCDGEVDEDFDVIGQPCDGDDPDLCEEGTYYCAADSSLACTDSGGGGHTVYYTFDNNVGFEAYDHSLHGQTGNLVSTEWTTGQTGHALQFNGTSSFVFAEASESCTALGWDAETYGDPNVCGTSAEGPGGCSGTLSFLDSIDFCARKGGRLCSYEELNADEVRDTGCGYDSKRIWSSTPCGDGRFWTQSGSSEQEAFYPKQCTPMAAAGVHVACCADVDPDPSLELNNTSAQHYSIEAWIKPDSVTGIQTIAIKAEPNGVTRTGIGLHLIGNRLSLGQTNCSGMISSLTVTTGVWQHVVGTWNSIEGRLYINGVEAGTMMGGPRNCATVRSWPLLVGAGVDGNGQLEDYFSGAIDQVTVYNRALTKTEIESNHVNGKNDVVIDSCNSHDDNCDGVEDESFPLKDTPCDSDDVDQCENGTYTCDGVGGLECVNETVTDITEICNGIDDDCDGSVPHSERDGDGDGSRLCDNDCDDDDPNTYPGAVEACDGVDNDCDGTIPTDESDNDLDGMEPCAGDCDDTDRFVYEGAVELCDDKDNNCDDQIDELYSGLGDLCDGDDPDQCAEGTYVCSDDQTDIDCTDNAKGGHLVYLTFDTNAGFTERDQTQNDNEAVAAGFTWAAGMNGTAARFDGDDDFGFIEATESCDQLHAAAGDTGWSTDGGSTVICGESDDGLGGCSGAVTFAEALAFCADGGARLCTQSELAAGEAELTGCGTDVSPKRYWTSTPCDNGRFYTRSGDPDNIAVYPEQCTPMVASNVHARCCADKVPNTSLRVSADLIQEYSIEAWIKPEKLSGLQTIASKTEPEAGWRSGISMQLNGALVNFGYANCGSMNSTTSLSVNTWSHVVGTWDGSAGRIYINGEPAGAVGGTPKNCAVVRSWPLLIGASIDGGSDLHHYFKGSIDQLAVYDRALDATEIASNYANTINDVDAEVCDNSDNNCDGTVDDGFDLKGDECDGDDSDLCKNGTYTCALNGTLECENETQTNIIEACNGIDDDCDGEVPANERDSDGDGYRICDGDCNDSDPNVYPNAPELCDGLDNDCDSFVDADDPVDLLAADTQNCEEQDGVCAGSTKPAELCFAGKWLPCGDSEYQVHSENYEAGTELSCDGLDNDCDNSEDEDFDFTLYSGTVVTGVGVACGIGLCDGGVTECNALQTGLQCSTGHLSENEVCDGEDNDCDGLIDADDAADMALYDSPLCENTDGVCSCAVKDASLCVDGEWLACTDETYSAHTSSYEPGAEVSCDDLDNDCDGKVDEDFTTTLLDGTSVTGINEHCGTGACDNGITVCDAFGTGIECSTEDLATDEVCDDVDNDCDGDTDADDAVDLLANDEQDCELQGGVCAGSTKPATHCVDGVWKVCAEADYVDYDANYEEDVELSCDALDNDCDGEVDEDFDYVLYNDDVVSGIGEDCGIGLCAGGVTECNAAQTGLQCSTAGLSEDEVCDGDDNDCDGLTDADDEADLLANDEQNCELQEGLCDGLTKPAALCVAGSWQECGEVEYEAHDPAYEDGVEVTCDGLDNDCDGSEDEDFDFTLYTAEIVSGVGVACGIGLCAGGVTECNTAQTGLQCSTGHLAEDEICDGEDNDCDALVDADDPVDLEANDSPICENTTGVCADATKDASLCVDGAWLECTDDTYSAHTASYEAGAEVSCDTLDNDCDGAIDEDFTTTLLDGTLVTGIDEACGTGVCAGGTTVCDALGTGIECNTEDLAGNEICDDLDNDCDGSTDAADPVDLLAHDEQNCEVQAGVCDGSTKPAALCVAGVWNACGDTEYSAHSANYEADVELSCDALDNDCDGSLDEDFTATMLDSSTATGIDQACGTGICAGGNTVCNTAGDGIICDTESLAANELCNALDDDCDGLTDVDDSVDLLAYDEQDCEVQDGVCSGSTKPVALCVDGAWLTCSDTEYSAHSANYEADTEVSCDALDNDCDADIDEDFTATLLDGTSVTGIDQSCGTGICAGGTTECNAAGNGILCNTEDLAADEVCNALDDDCDGTTDASDPIDLVANDLQDCEDQDGVCAGSTKPAALCVDGVWTECGDSAYSTHATTYESGTESSCDALDNDCDAETDEDFTITLLDGASVTGIDAGCGTGICAGGTTQCNAAQDNIECSTEGLAVDETCDDLDNDCDGGTDETFPTLGADCDGDDSDLCENGTFTCMADGTDVECVNETIEDITEVCDGIDNDCDVEVDEDFTYEDDSGVRAIGETCEGIGACGTGVVECVGDLAADCSTNPDGSADESMPELCNSEDDDCDEEIDEKSDGSALTQACYTGGAGTENVGTCVGGEQTCEDGAYGTCEGEITEVPDTVCDGLDENCNGVADDEYVASTCGIGACESTSSCTDGTENACIPGDPAPDDAVCDGIDSDCDGVNDEDYVPAGCGTGACANESVCTDGVESDCEPLPATGDDTDCDAVDDDCDGETDESYTDHIDCTVDTCTDGVNANIKTDSLCDDGEPCTDDICTAESADDGGCSYTADDSNLPDLTLADSNLCTDLVCQGGTSVNVNDDTNIPDDGLSCTDDSCLAGVEIHTTQSDDCLIDGICYREGDANSCDEFCAPKVDQEAFSNQMLAEDFDTIYPGTPTLTIEDLEGTGVTWVETNFKRHTGLKSLYFGDLSTHTYESGTDRVHGTATSEATELPSLMSIQLRFWTWIETEEFVQGNNYDHLKVNILRSNGTITDLIWDSTEFGGTTENGWRQVIIDISDYQSNTVQLQFEFDSGDGKHNDFEGVYIDDIQIISSCCLANSDCDDDDSCTVDLCGAGGECQFTYTCEECVPTGATIALTLGQNQTMDDTFYEGDFFSKWDHLSTAFDTVLPDYQELVNLSLNAGPTVGLCDGNGELEVGFHASNDEIQDYISSIIPENFAGVASNIAEARDLLLDASFEGPTFVLVVADSADQCAGDPAQVIEDMFIAHDIHTLVIGMGNVPTSTYNDWAINGGHPKVQTTPGDPVFWQAEDPTSLVDALNTIFTNAVGEQCDNIDNDCDGLTDEDIPVRGCNLHCGSGGEQTCSAGEWSTCTKAPETELCDGVDNDCDGVTDENFPLLGQPCSIGQGWCQAWGVYTCSADPSAPVVCDAPVIAPQTEVCDNVDNDCNGQTDEALTRNCDTSCGVGTEECVAGEWVNCTSPPPVPEVCDAIDNDCDGQTDEKLDGDALERPCENACGPGTETCTLGIWGSCNAASPLPEICDNIDNDCDDMTDEDLAGLPLTQLCFESSLGNPGVGLCVYGLETCQPGGVWGTCEGQVLPEDEVCDNLDNDCDGMTDEDEGGTPLTKSCYTGPADTLGVGVCHSGLQSCIDGAFHSDCAGEVTPVDEGCDGLDNDCDGNADEDPGGICLDVPECAGGLCICTIGPFGDWICVPD